MHWVLGALAVPVAALAVAGALEPPQMDLRKFDPKAVARAETAMWRSYYDHRRIALLLQLGCLLRERYKMSWIRSQTAAYHAARAAVVFQKGQNRPDYERALPDLEAYYGSIRTRSSVPFDVKEAARRELEWWIVHRERARYGKERLVRTLADLQATVYGLPADLFGSTRKRGPTAIGRESTRFWTSRGRRCGRPFTN